MGGRLVLPTPDERIKKDIIVARLSVKELASFYKYFQKLDKDRIGYIFLTKLYEHIEFQRNLYTDCICELLDISHDGRVSFAEFLDIIITYCLFEKCEILKYKLGYFEPEELKLLMNMLHNIKNPDKVKGNVKASWYSLEISDDDRIVFQEFQKFHDQYPRLFEPAFQLQIKLVNAFMGERWWARKKRKLQNIKDAKKAKEERKIAKKHKRRERLRSNKIRKKMGILRYYFLPCFRAFYLPPVKAEVIPEPEDEKEKKAKAVAQARREADINVKNLETVEWQKFESKINPQKGGNEEYLEVKINKIDRKRDMRKDGRRDKRKERADRLNDGFEIRPTKDFDDEDIP